MHYAAVNDFLDVLLPSAGERRVRPVSVLHLHATEEEILRLQQHKSLKQSVTSEDCFLWLC